MSEEPLIIISDPDADRYARLHLMGNYQQETIQRAKVMVVGAGALGNEVLKNLALLGVGHIVVVDFDTIEISNLTRSVLFRQEDQGQPKATIAAQRVRQLNPDVQVIPVHGDVAHDVGLGVFRDVDVVLGCLDNRTARLAVNLACQRVGTPWVDGGLNRADGSVRTFVPGAGACYECLMTKQDYELAHIRYSCPPGTFMDGVQVTTPMAASIIAAMQVQEAVKVLHGQSVQAGHGVIYSAETLRLTHMDYTRRKDCPAHQSYEPIVSLAAGVNDLTVGDLLGTAAEHLDDVALLSLPEKIATYAYCPVCETLEPVFRPLRLVQAQPCVKGHQNVYDVVSTLALSETTRAIPLTQLGIPSLAILEVRTPRRRRAYFELSGDRGAMTNG